VELSLHPFGMAPSVIHQAIASAFVVLVLMDHQRFTSSRDETCRNEAGQVREGCYVRQDRVWTLTVISHVGGFLWPPTNSQVRLPS